VRRLIEDKQVATGRQHAGYDIQPTVCLLLEQADIDREDTGEAFIAKVRMFQRLGADLSLARTDVLQILPGSQLNHVHRAIDGGDLAIHQAIAHQ
jgi:hypothetical protein